MGTGCWQGATDLELYGCLIHDFGVLRNRGRGGGHAAYIQNATGTKRFEHNVAYRGCGWNFDLFTRGGNLKNIDLIENIAFLASWYKEGQVGFNYGLSGEQPAERIRFIGNVGYQHRGQTQKWRSNMRLVAETPVIHKGGVIKNNYMMGCYRAFVLGRWKKIEVTGNTFWATHALAEVGSSPSGSGLPQASERPDLKEYAFDNNTYIDNGVKKNFAYSIRERHEEDDLLTFAEWQKLGLDKHSRMVPGRQGRPTGTKTFVFPNKHRKGRAHVAVFNWDGKAAVAVDLSAVLKQGQQYRVYNCLDIKQTFALAKPVLQGVYSGKALALPMRRFRDLPDFDAFVVLPE
jgi:hypothetical protein